MSPPIAPPPVPAPPGTVARAVGAWFRRNARPFPWRTLPLGAPRDPYAVLVSELMLQQTQAPRVAQRFPAFLARFPSPDALAAASDDDVLSLWQGLGYYRRATALRDAARAILSHHDGRVPSDPGQLMRLPGVGRYTAGAVASLAFNLPLPMVDANIARVLARLDGVPTPQDARARAALWDRAAAIARASRTPALVNEGLMEIGATLCAPRQPRCERCPLARLCRARTAGVKPRTPAPPRSRPAIHAAAVVVRSPAGRLLLTRRPDHGLWAGLWEVPTLQRSRPIAPASLARSLRLDPGDLVPAGAFDHRTTHRLIRFKVYRCRVHTRSRHAIESRFPHRRWLPPARLPDAPLSSAQRRVLALAGVPSGSGGAP